MKYVIMAEDRPIAVAHSENDAQEFILSCVEEEAYARFCENPDSDFWPLWYYDAFWYHAVPEISPFPQNSFLSLIIEKIFPDKTSKSLRTNF